MPPPEHLRRHDIQQLSSGPVREYGAYGLRLCSAIALPFDPLPGPSAEPDVTVRLGAVPATLPAGPGNVTRTPIGEARSGAFVMLIEGVARYLVTDGRDVLIEPLEGDDDVVGLFCVGLPFTTLLQQRGVATLHAAAVATEAGAVLLLGRSGIGKSSLAAALVERGYPLLADDVTGVALDAGGRPVALPALLPQRLWTHTLDKMKWRPRAYAKIRRDVEKYWVRAERHCATPLPVRAAFVLNSEERPDIAIESVSPSVAFWTLWRYTHCRRVMDAMGQRPAHFRAVTTMAWSVPLGRVVRPKHPFLLEALTDRIEAHLCKAGPSGNGEARKKTPPELPAAFRRSPGRRPPSVPVTRRHDRVAAAPSCARTGDGVAGASGPGIVWLASYPKSGNTWLRAVLTNYLREDDEPASINALAGNRYNSRDLFDEFVGINSSDMTDAEVARYRARLREFLAEKVFAAGAVSGETFHRDGRFFGKTHEAYRVPDGAARFRRGGTAGVVYLVRNPLDVAVSFAHHVNRSIDHIIRVMADPAASDPPSVRGISEHLPEAMTTWSGHVSSWTAQSELSIHVARYEDLLKDPCSGFGAIVRFAGLEWDDARLDRAIGHAAFPRLRAQEEQDGFVEKLPAAPSFFRAGVAGSWRTALTRGQVKALVDAHGEVMERLGYLRDAEAFLRG